MERDVMVICPRCNAQVGDYCRAADGETWDVEGPHGMPVKDVHIVRADQARIEDILKRLDAATPQEEQMMLERIAAGLPI